MRVLVTGSRDWSDRTAIYRALYEHCQSKWEMGYDGDGHPVDYLPPTDFVLVHGACPTGADAIADGWGIIQWVTVERHPAKWDKYGKRAGFLRNAEMVAMGADLCLAFIKDNSRGATMCANLAESVGIPTIRYTE